MSGSQWHVITTEIMQQPCHKMVTHHHGHVSIVSQCTECIKGCINRILGLELLRDTCCEWQVILRWLLLLPGEQSQTCASCLSRCWSMEWNGSKSNWKSNQLMLNYLNFLTKQACRQADLSGLMLPLYLGEHTQQAHSEAQIACYSGWVLGYLFHRSTFSISFSSWGVHRPEKNPRFLWDIWTCPVSFLKESTFPLPFKWIATNF